ncbi:unnamed protein product [Lymnaea stagnalis]|uniref:UBC core domain-containing protein n=1 Tax=Lymnaea stagnalis TaxID=6523 RepID=A0AAV2HR68_LYMST
MTSLNGSLLKEVHRLRRDIKKLTVDQAQFEDFETDCDEWGITFNVLISPNDGHYRGATFRFKFEIPANYPEKSPYIRCLNNIYHPNIDFGEDGTVCVNLLDKDWQPGVGLDGCVMAVLFLFYEPNLEDALNPVFDGQLMNEDEFHSKIRASLRGEEVEGFVFDKLLNEESVCLTKGKDVKLIDFEDIQSEESAVKREKVTNAENLTIINMKADGVTDEQDESVQIVTIQNVLNKKIISNGEHENVLNVNSDCVSNVTVEIFSTDVKNTHPSSHVDEINKCETDKDGAESGLCAMPVGLIKANRKYFGSNMSGWNDAALMFEHIYRWIKLYIVRFYNKVISNM